MPFTPTLGDNADLNEVRSQMRAAGEYLLELRRQPEDQRGESYADDVRSAVDVITMFDSVESALAAGQRAADDQARAAEAERLQRLGIRGPQAAGADLSDRPLSPGASFVATEGYEEWAARGARGGNFQAEVRALLTSGDNDDLAGDNAAGVWRPVGTPTLRPGTARQQRLFVRDLISVQPTGLSSVPYIREVNAATNETGVTTVSEGSAKPEVTMEWTQHDAPIRKIAGWIPATTEILSDAPTLRGYINARLEYMLDIREEAQVYDGNGTAPNLQGLKTVTGVQTQSAVTGDFPATIAAAIGKVENVDGQADGVGANPVTFWTAVAKRHAEQFDNGGGGNAPASMQGITWGLPCVRSRIFAAADAMVADWRGGATIFQRQGTMIKVSDSHSDNFIKDIQVIRATRRIALPIWRPDWFVDVDVPTS